MDTPGGSDYFAELSNYDSKLDKQAYDMIFSFVLDMPALKQLVERVIERCHLHDNGYLFAAYPKKGNNVYATFIHRDELMPGLECDEEGYIGSSNLKFARMVGLDDVFTVVGFKLEKRATKQASSKASQRVDDYVERIPNVEKLLEREPMLLAFYQSLTPGYRKDWARYIYSAKQEATQVKRIEEMQMILQAGFKSRELYRQSQS
ncbi:MAG: YdeI/OmpD-associated family protein [Candidatus Cohnella colombiensis]|uniref:YdeI/OmpD-associated family protein n=1 Tax=Candidatus Cohnella colombiensis TaxID=3121368 RepID=A0AA95EY40_9BACL|nr:MAG: YdeI/OmpD-associated family protein [Cohnella sp.]